LFFFCEGVKEGSAVIHILPIMSRFLVPLFNYKIVNTKISDSKNLYKFYPPFLEITSSGNAEERAAAKVLS